MCFATHVPVTEWNTSIDRDRVRTIMYVVVSSLQLYHTHTHTHTHTLTHSPTHFGTLPKRQGSKGDEGVGGSMKPKVVGRSLPNERYPRSGSWNSHMRRSNPVLPSKYSTPPPERSK